MIIEESGKDDLKNHDMFVMVTLSYGPENDRSIYGIDKGLVALDATIEDQFNGRLAPNLIGKPKLFITRILINDQGNYLNNVSTNYLIIFIGLDGAEVSSPDL